MAKKPEIEHEYHAKKDTLKITIHGYALKSKASRDAIMKKIMVEVEKTQRAKSLATDDTRP